MWNDQSHGMAVKIWLRKRKEERQEGKSRERERNNDVQSIIKGVEQKERHGRGSQQADEEFN